MTTTMRITRRGRLALMLIPTLAIVAAYAFIASRGVLELGGLENDQTFGVTAPAVTASLSGNPGRLSITLDDVPVIYDEAIGAIALGDLAEGSHTLVARYQRLAPFSDIVQQLDFSVDLTGPVIHISAPLAPVAYGGGVTVAGTVDDINSLVTVGGTPATVDGGGAFEVRFESIPSQTIEVTSSDQVGNVSIAAVPIVLALPGAEGEEPIRGVHASGYTWVTPSLRDPILQLIEDGLINTVQLDLKDESGFVWYNTDVRLAHEIGAVTELFSLAEVVDDLHARGVRVVGRIVNFRDPILADHAVSTGQTDWLVLDSAGNPLQQYGGFTNPFSDDVRQYNIDLAAEAAALGVDDILLDYVRRPDAPLSSMQFPGSTGTPEDAIVSFLAACQAAVHQNGGRLGASVFGIAATRPLEIAQDIPRMSAHVDYVAPMVYPSHWGPGEYGVADPDRQPYDIVYLSLLDFENATEGSEAQVIAWLQDFSLGSSYGAAEVKAQIEASLDAGVDGFLLWDPAATYTSDGLTPQNDE